MKNKIILQVVPLFYLFSWVPIKTDTQRDCIIRRLAALCERTAFWKFDRTRSVMCDDNYLLSRKMWDLYVLRKIRLNDFTEFYIGVSIALGLHLKSLNAKTDISMFINLRYLRLKLLKTEKMCDCFHHNFKNKILVTVDNMYNNIISFIRTIRHKWGIEKVVFCSIWWWTYFKNFDIGIYRFLHSSSFIPLNCGVRDDLSIAAGIFLLWNLYKDEI